MQFTRQFKYVQAAGGLVRKPKKNFLMIFRNGRWDIPKGHMKKGERPEYAAIREVEEECGIAELSIKKPLDQTYHMYKRNGITYVKKTFWFIMKTRYSGELVPQVEEGIDEVRWCSKDDLPMILDNTFPLIKELLNKALKLKGSVKG
jgi:8-oxo-dGTP pyrophosphatase MutT (NUDIX family)